MMRLSLNNDEIAHHFRYLKTNGLIFLSYMYKFTSFACTWGLLPWSWKLIIYIYMYVNTGMFHGLAWQQMRINKGHNRNLHARAASFVIVMLGLRGGLKRYALWKIQRMEIYMWVKLAQTDFKLLLSNLQYCRDRYSPVTCICFQDQFRYCA